MNNDNEETVNDAKAAKPAAKKGAAKSVSTAKTAAKPAAKAAAKTPAGKNAGGKSAAGGAVKTAAKKKPSKKPVKKAELLKRSPELEDEYGLKLFFQPVYQVSQRRVYGYECLLRIVDKELGVITPDLFLSVARKNPTLMKGIEEWSLREIFKTSRLFRENKRYLEMLSLNIDTANFVKKDFYDKVSAYLEKITENIYFELKEDVFFDGGKEVAETLRKLREAGIKIAVDDFTANFLTFDWGKEVPFDMIKIERTYIDRFLTSPKARLIVEKIAEFGKDRGLELVAVGVESKEQEEALSRLGIDKMQGYYYSKPMQFKRLAEQESRQSREPEGISAESAAVAVSGQSDAPEFSLDAPQEKDAENARTQSDNAAVKAQTQGAQDTAAVGGEQSETAAAAQPETAEETKENAEPDNSPVK